MPTTGDVLTLDQIDELLSNTKTRGRYKPVIRDFAKSGEQILEVTDKFGADVKVSAMVQSIKLTIPKIATDLGDEMPELNCITSVDKAKVYLINMDANRKAKEAAALAAAAAQDSE